MPVHAHGRHVHKTPESLDAHRCAGQQLGGFDVDLRIHVVADSGFPIGGGDVEDIVDVPTRAADRIRIVDLALDHLAAQALQLVAARGRPGDHADRMALPQQCVHQSAPGESGSAGDKGATAFGQLDCIHVRISGWGW